MKYYYITPANNPLLLQKLQELKLEYIVEGGSLKLLKHNLSRTEKLSLLEVTDNIKG